MKENKQLLSQITQGSYVALINYLFEKITKKIPAKTREVLIFLIFFVYSIYFIAFRSANIYGAIGNDVDYCEAFGAILLMLVTVLSIKKQVDEIKWRSTLVFTLLPFGLLLVIIGILHPIGEGYGFFGLELLTIYPCLFIVWNNRGDYESLFDKISTAFMLTGIGYFLWFAYLDYMNSELVYNGRHQGGMFNANFVSFIGVTLACVSSYYLYRCFVNKKRRTIAMITVGIMCLLMGAVLIVKGQSRTGIATLLGTITIVTIFLFKKQKIVLKRNNCIKYVVILAIVLVAIIGLIVARNGNIQMLERFDTSNKTANEFTSGRVELWKSYAGRLNLLGHDMSLVDYEELTGNLTRHAHNNFLEFSFRCGVLTGFFCIAFQLITGILTLGLVFIKKANRDYEVFVTIFIFNYLIFSLLDIATIPMTNYAAFFFYICVMPLFVDKNERRVKVV